MARWFPGIAGDWFLWPEHSAAIIPRVDRALSLRATTRIGQAIPAFIPHRGDEPTGMSIAKVHLVFKTHVDVGFTDMAATVLQRYREIYIPAALDTAAALRAAGGEERLIWTLPAWIVWDALERGGAVPRRAIENGITAGDLTWHALPFTFHSELMDASLFRHGLSVAGRLDRRFGRKTIAAKMTDVPGHTRGIVPILAEAGIEFLHIGVNEASPVPDVPPVFRWRAGGAEIVVAYERGYGGRLSLPGCDAALCFAHTHDNRGPQDAEGVRAAFRGAREEFPGAVPAASSLDDFAAALRPIRASLPVVEAEIGDSWIHGAASDPVKLAGFRAAMRLRSRWIEERPGTEHEPEMVAFSDALLLVPEHTWGMDHKAILDDWTSYAGEPFEAARRRPTFQKLEASWREQRAYLATARDALTGDRRRELASALDAVSAAPAPFVGVATGEVIDLGRFHLRISPTGGLAELVDLDSARRWNGTGEFLRLWREGFGAADYRRFWTRYNVNTDDPEIAWWAGYDFQKPGLPDVRAGHRCWSFALQDLALDRGAEASRLCVALRASDDAVSAGAPRRAELRYAFHNREPRFDLEVLWWEKPATRLPEATWLSFAPDVAAPRNWALDKLGQRVSPDDVVRRDGMHGRAAADAASYAGADGRILFCTLDAALIAPGTPRLLDYREAADVAAGGLHVNLHNNVWGTNFPAWCGDGARFRFRVVLDPPVRAG